jgi:hypothetical protein
MLKVTVVFNAFSSPALPVATPQPAVVLLSKKIAYLSGSTPVVGASQAKVTLPLLRCSY